MKTMLITLLAAIAMTAPAMAQNTWTTQRMPFSNSWVTQDQRGNTWTSTPAPFSFNHQVDTWGSNGSHCVTQNVPFSFNHERTTTCY
jgi:hypothetical protein